MKAKERLNKFSDNEPSNYKDGQEVQLLISSQSDLGYNVLVNDTHFGVLYKNEVFQTLKTGQKIKGYIKKVREDGKIDLSLHKPGYKKVDTLAWDIIEMLNRDGGFIRVNDKSNPEEIYKLFGTSKSTFKKAIGNLYKKRVIEMTEEGIKLREK